MKKLSIALGLILSGYSAYSFSYNFPRCVSIPRLNGGPIFGANGLYWKASALQNDFTVGFPGVSTTSPSFTNGRFHDVNLDYDWGFQGYLGYIFPCSANDILLTYTYYENEDRIGGFRDANFSPSLSLPAIVTIPLPTITVAFSDITNTIAGEAFDLIVDNFQVESAKVDYDQRTWDLDAGQHINIGCNWFCRFYAGLRYAHLERKFNEVLSGSAAGTDSITTSFPSFGADVILDFDFTTIVTEHVSEKSKFDGVGPRIGMDIGYRLGGGFSVVAGGSTSMLIGESESSFRNNSIADSSLTLTAVETEVPELVTVTGITLGVPVLSSSETTVAYHRSDDTRIVPNLDGKLGIAFNYNFHNCGRSSLILEAGYRINHYFNGVDILSESDAITPEDRAHQTNDVSFYGPYIGITIAI